MIKHLLSKGIKIFLAFALVFAFGLQAYAAEGKALAPANNELITGYCEYINPLCGQSEDFSIDFQDVDFSKAPVFKAHTTDEVVNAIRNGLANRLTSFIVNSTSYFNINVVFDQIYNHTGNPKHGDYLLWNTAKIGLSCEGYSFDMDYYVTSSFFTNAYQEQVVDAKIPEVISSLNLKGMSEYRKVKAIYDYICANVEYDFDNLEDDSYDLKYSTYAALMNKKAVCQGYATLFYRMCLQAGIDARVISGDGGGPHAWNIVKVGKYYYNVDSTWDAGYDEYIWFLRCENNFINHKRDEDYLKNTFVGKYPMGKNDYVEGQGDVTFEIRGNGKTLLICGTGAMAELGEIPPGWYKIRKDFTKIVIEEGVTTISALGLAMCENVETVEIADSVKSIGDLAFLGCSNLKSLKIGNSVTTIGDYAFSLCTSLESVTFSESVTDIGEGAFESSANLTLLGGKGSLAEEYAAANGFRFRILADLDGDGICTLKDAKMVINYIKQAHIYPLTDVQSERADINGDGRIDIIDFNYIYNSVYNK